MGRTARRIRQARKLVERSVRRDLRRRKVRRTDTDLAPRTMSGNAAFEAQPPNLARTLPVVEVQLQSPSSYQRALEDKVAAALAHHGIPFVPNPGMSGAAGSLDVRGEDWDAMLEALAFSDLDVLYGGSRRRSHPSRPLYLDTVDADAFRNSRVLYLLRPAVTRHHGGVIKRYGFECAVRIERWKTVEDGTVAPTIWSPRTATLPVAAFSSSHAPSAATLEARLPLTEPNLMEVDFPIDVVYTWVDGTDSDWIERKRSVLEDLAGEEMSDDAAADLRFVAHDELRHSLRSLELYAPWIRHVYIVSDRQRPDWLREEDPWVSIVDHTDIAPDGAALPTFNSQAIEANLHRIEGLSEHFIYFNDDVFLSSPITPELFFGPNGIASMYLSRAQVANGDPVLGEPASDSAGKRSRELVMETVGRRVSRKLFHTPFALQRSVSYAIEEHWPDVVANTRRSQFRRIEDVTLSGALHMNYAYATGRAVTRSIRYRYVNIGAANAQKRLDSLMKDSQILQTFCLNEASSDLSADRIDSMVRRFLRLRFPDMGSFEIPGR